MCLDTPVSSADVVTPITCSQINAGREQGASHTLLLCPVYLVSPQCPDSCTPLTQLWHPLPTVPHCRGRRWTAWWRGVAGGCARGYLRNDSLCLPASKRAGQVLTSEPRLPHLSYGGRAKRQAFSIALVANMKWCNRPGWGFMPGRLSAHRVYYGTC